MAAATLVAKAPAAGAPVSPKRPTIEQVAEGVYVFIHPDATEDWPQGNTILIIGARGCLVVDSSYLPSTARRDIEEIRKLTDKPVRYLLNTHWHYDHHQGNRAWLDAFPGLDIVAQAETRRLMNANAAGYASRVTAAGSKPRQALEALRAAAATGKAADGTTLSATERALLPSRIADREGELAELEQLEYQAPTLTFERALTLYLGNREVQIRHAYRGNTPGDAYVYLPAEKVLITGDLLVHPVPFAFNSYPGEWIRTLEVLDELPAAILVPGHGPVLRDHAYLRRVKEMLEAVMVQVTSAATRNVPLDQLRQHVDLEPFRREFAGDDPAKNALFEEVFLTPILERAFREAKGQQ